MLDAAGDVRAHPAGKLGAMGLTERPGYRTVQAVAGGNRRLHGELRVVTEGEVVTTSNVLRDVSVRAGGFIAAARHPVEAAWVKRHAALGAISDALSLGSAMRKAATSVAQAIIDAVCSRPAARFSRQARSACSCRPVRGVASTTERSKSAVCNCAF